MVRVCRRVSRKRYFGKTMYEYERFMIPVPKKFHEAVKPFLGKSLNVTVAKKGESLIIRLFPRKEEREPLPIREILKRDVKGPRENVSVRRKNPL